MLVRLWMSARLAVLLPDVRVSDALRHLRRTGVGHVAVVCRGRVLGVLSEADLRAAGAGRDPYVWNAHAILADVLREGVGPISPMEPIEHAARVMLERRVGALAVVHEGRVVGVITAAGVLRAFTELVGAEGRATRLVVSAPRPGTLLEEIRARIARGPELCGLAAHPVEGGWEGILRLQVPPDRAERCA